jgi:hypothetical protein
MKSSKGTSTRNLAFTPLQMRARKLLVALANLPDEGGLRRLQEEFPYLLKDLNPLTTTMNNFPDADVDCSYYGSPSTPEEKWKYWLLPLRDTFRALWREPDLRTKQWATFRISQDFFSQGRGDLLRGPFEGSFDIALMGLKPRTSTERLLLEFTELAELTRYCGNPGCPTPFFIARRRSQKYCSCKCSKPAQREAKLKWWRNTGKNRRAAAAKCSK